MISSLPVLKFSARYSASYPAVTNRRGDKRYDDLADYNPKPAGSHIRKLQSTRVDG
jgi:hypothetical protein